MSDPSAAEVVTTPRPHRLTSLTRRLIGVAAIWITVLLLGGGYALDRVLTSSLIENFDKQLEYVLNAMIAASEIGPDAEVRFNRPPADQRFLEPYSGVYFQVSGEGADTFPSRSLWDRRLAVNDRHNDVSLHTYDSREFEDEPLRIVERDVILPGSDVRWRSMISRDWATWNRQRTSDPGSMTSRSTMRSGSSSNSRLSYVWRLTSL